MIYLGSLGRMIGIKCPASQNVQAEERHSFSTTLEGRRKAQVRQAGRRTWGLNAQFADPSEHSLLSQFANGAWGNGPFVFVSADAPVSNMLTPAAASCMPGEYVLTTNVEVFASPPLLTPDGWAASSFMKSTNNGLFLGKEMLPVVPGRPVTVAAYVRGAGGAVQLHWYDQSGDAVGSATSSVTATASTVVRSHVTRVAPAGAVGCRVSVNSQAAQVAWPSATWSDDLLPFGDGQGCPKAVVHGVSSDVRLAVPGATYLNLSFTVSEVG